jgi:hypothetical protein
LHFFLIAYLEKYILALETQSQIQNTYWNLGWGHNSPLRALQVVKGTNIPNFLVGMENSGPWEKKFLSTRVL